MRVKSHMIIKESEIIKIEFAEKDKEMNEELKLVEDQLGIQMKRKEIKEIENQIQKNEGESNQLGKKINEINSDLSTKRKDLIESEKEKMKQQIIEADNKIKELEFEHEDLIEDLINECNDENGKCIFPDLVASYPTQTSSNSFLSSSSLSFSIRLSEALTIKPSKCEILQRIGDGGFSNVYKMKMKKRSREEDTSFTAFKQFSISGNSIKEDEIRMIEREIEMLEHLEHPNIVKIIGAIGDPNARDINNERMGIGIVMEYCENGSLRSLLNKNTNVNQHQQLLNMDLIIHLLFGAAQGLEYLHNHTPHAIIHGDIKSDNILIDKEYNAKLCDFGISKLQQTTTASTRDGSGTLAYKAPETFVVKVERKSDVYSFGCVILEMLTGERPWYGLGNDVGTLLAKMLVIKEQHDLSKIRNDTREELIDLMKRCLDYDNVKRPTMNEVRMELEKMMNNAVLIGLDYKSDEYNKVENIFFPGGDKEGSLNRNDYRIVKIDKVRHLFAERRYDAELSNTKSILNDNDANERLLFHGTSKTDSMEILSHPDAFMKDYSSGGFYGRGLYFAELARYSNKYRYNIEGTNQHQMLVCSVICGNQKQYGLQTNRDLSQKDLGKEHHSIHAGPHRPAESGPGEDDSCMYVIYKDTQALPKYLITYESIEPE